jgi:hypothetical protein
VVEQHYTIATQIIRIRAFPLSSRREFVFAE